MLNEPTNEPELTEDEVRALLGDEGPEPRRVPMDTALRHALAHVRLRNTRRLRRLAEGITRRIGND
jgi:hypothetical protein